MYIFSSNSKWEETMSDDLQKPNGFISEDWQMET